MNAGRRHFLKIAGVALLGAGASTVLAGSDWSKAGRSHPPRMRRRWAMVVDVKKCPAGCSECIKACSNAHGLGDAGRRIAREAYCSVFLGPGYDFVREHGGAALSALKYPSFCNHCDEPPCVMACSSGATWKREDGIVAVDASVCTGCRSCMAACPYGARTIETCGSSAAKQAGKCTFCADRLTRGEMPACVEACAAKSLVCGDLADPSSEVSALLAGSPALVRLPHLGTAPHVFYLA